MSRSILNQQYMMLLIKIWEGNVFFQTDFRKLYHLNVIHAKFKRKTHNCGNNWVNSRILTALDNEKYSFNYSSLQRHSSAIENRFKKQLIKYLIEC